MSPFCQLEMTLPGDFAGVFGVTIRLMSDRELGRFDVVRDSDQRAGFIADCTRRFAQAAGRTPRTLH
jgi:hypothetical protein